MSSLKMTFSLTSLILIFAFAVMPVIAHGPGVTPTAVPETHNHPVNTAIADDPLTTGVTENVATHNHHPMVTSITLKGDNTRGTMAAVSGTTVGTTDVFTLVIQFDRDIVTTGTVRVVPTGTDRDAEAALVADGDFTDAILNVDGTASGAAINFADSTRAEGSDDTIEVVATISTAFPSGTDDTNDKEFTLRVRLNANAVFSLATFPDFAEVPGGNSLQSDTYTFTLVNALPDLPPEPADAEGAPTVTITAADDLNAMGEAVFTITFSEPLGTAANALQVGDFTITGGTAADLTGPETVGTGDDAVENVYTLNVTPDDADAPTVSVTLNADSVADLAGMFIDLTDAAASTAVFDQTPPTVMITAPMEPDADGNLTFTFDFSEDVVFNSTHIDRAGSDNVRLGADSDPEVDMTDSTVYTVLVEPVDSEVATTVLLLKDSVMDTAGNGLAADADATYTPPGAESTDPTITIEAVGYMSGMDVVGLNCEVGNVLTITAMDDVALAADAEVVMSEVSASEGWKIVAGATEGSIMVVPNGDGSEIGVTSVTVTVAAGAVEDAAGNENAATSETFTVGPVLMIPGGGYIVVIRPEHKDVTHLGDPLYIGHTGVRAPQIIPQYWECMPDLTVFFGRAAPAIGGGALVVKASPENGTAIAKGSVGITEIMWASDEGIAHGGTPRTGNSNLDQTKEQWIELHNRNTTAVKVTLVARPTNAALKSDTDEIDRVSNYNIDNVWQVKGQSGNSARGVDFVSMKRAQAGDKNYDHGDVSGTNAGKWSASTLSYQRQSAGLAATGVLASENLIYDFRGTPGRSNNPGISTPTQRTNVPKDSIVFNEIANRRDQTLEWIELKNVSDAEVNLKKYQISIATATGTDNAFYTFPDNDNIKLAAGEILLLLDTDPRDNDNHPIAVAFNRDGGNDQALGIGDNAIKYKIANFPEGGLPDDGNFVLYLRNRNDRLKSHEGVIDAIGWSDKLTDASLHTKFWPLKVFDGRRWGNGGPDERNKIAVEFVHRRQHLIDPDQNTHGDDKDEHQALRDVGYTGIGYKRHAQNTAAHGGTPGHEDTRKNLVADISSTGTLTISEIMYDQGDGDYPQWIEIYNSSPTQPVNLHSEAGWRLVVENFDDDEIPIARLSGTLNFKNSEVQTILPQQTVIVASTRARSSGSAFFDTRVIFPATRVFSVWDDQRAELGMQRSRDAILSTQGFYIELIDGKGNFSDGVGNLVKSPNRRVAATIEWALSDINGGMGEDMPRSSILRKYNEYKDNKLVGRYSDAEIEDMGVTADGWRAAYETGFLNVRQTWYGHQSDHGSPGITGGRVLPVSLSKFRPERFDTGEIVVRWITESELNNAGFNILRSETRDGQFTKINTSLIAGQGTTSERTTYEWKDTSAKPNVVYYYQIQDVSLDGKVQTLRQSRLKGHVSPAGKLTTTWGELRTLQ